MNTSNSFHVVLFDSTSATLLAEKILKVQGIPFKIIPVPRHISSDCGVCIRVLSSETERIADALAGKVDIRDICPLAPRL
jgi:hypothetical protein